MYADIHAFVYLDVDANAYANACIEYRCPCFHNMYVIRHSLICAASVLKVCMRFESRKVCMEKERGREGRRGYRLRLRYHAAVHVCVRAAALLTI